MDDKSQHTMERIYYSMGEVAEMFDVNPSLIRFWEQKFDIIKPHKNKKGNRLFTPEDVENLKIIYHLVKEKGMTLAGAQMRMKQNREGLERDMEVVERLQSIKALLLQIRQELKEDDEVLPSVTIIQSPALVESTATPIYIYNDASEQAQAVADPEVQSNVEPRHEPQLEQMKEAVNMVVTESMSAPIPAPDPELKLGIIPLPAPAYVPEPEPEPEPEYVPPFIQQTLF